MILVIVLQVLICGVSVFPTNHIPAPLQYLKRLSFWQGSTSNVPVEIDAADVLAEILTELHTLLHVAGEARIHETRHTGAKTNAARLRLPAFFKATIPDYKKLTRDIYQARLLLSKSKGAYVSTLMDALNQAQFLSRVAVRQLRAPVVDTTVSRTEARRRLIKKWSGQLESVGRKGMLSVITRYSCTDCETQC